MPTLPAARTAIKVHMKSGAILTTSTDITMDKLANSLWNPASIYIFDGYVVPGPGIDFIEVLA